MRQEHLGAVGQAALASYGWLSDFERGSGEDLRKLGKASRENFGASYLGYRDGKRALHEQGILHGKGPGCFMDRISSEHQDACVPTSVSADPD